MITCAVNVPSFKGLWENKAPLVKNDDSNENGSHLGSIYIQEQIYHPFKDENIDTFKLGKSGEKYLDYDEEDDNFGNENVSTTIHVQKLGSRLDITTAEYESLCAQREAGLQAAHKLSLLGGGIKPVNRAGLGSCHNVQCSIESIDSTTIDKILASIDYKA